MRILGIDPGSRKTGWGVIDVASPRQLIHVGHGILYLDTENDLPNRMAELAQRIGEVTRELVPTHAAIEDVFMSENARSALMLGQARGAVMAALGLLNIPVTGFATTTVKQTVTGTGRATKVQVGQMVKALLNLADKPPEDAGDALALAICLANSLSHRRERVAPIRKSLADIARAQGKL